MNCNSRITYDKNCNIVVHELDYDSDYAYAYILQLNKTTGITTYSYIRDSVEKEAVFHTDYDGFYTLITLKISKSIDQEYYYNNNKVYHLNTPVSIQTLAEMNPDFTGLSVEHENYFLTCHLKNCFIDICQKIFSQAKSCNKGNIDSLLIYKRDLIWAALNTIEYLVEQEQYAEAQKTLERITSCNGLCGESNPCRKSHCGCSKV